jgi:hypothetical protein
MEFRFRPIQDWPPEFTTEGDRKPSPFRASYGDTLALLTRELWHLGADSAVIEIAVTEGDIRLDGLPRAGARPEHPGVIVSFDSVHGPLRYGTDAFGVWVDDWQANLRAIALGLEALRKVDRYGIGGRGEQYQGWKALPAGDGPNPVRGKALIDEHGSVRDALFATHPDQGGDARDFADVQAARASA